MFRFVFLDFAADLHQILFTEFLKVAARRRSKHCSRTIVTDVLRSLRNSCSKKLFVVPSEVLMFIISVV
jgi:hypothetical protein